MPDPTTGQWYAADHVADLQVRGFDGFNALDLLEMVNDGYFHVARKSQWYWERTTDAFTLNPGSAFVTVGTGGTELPNFRGIERLYVSTAGQQRKLQPLFDDDFFEKWLYKDLTAAQSRGEPSGYYVYQNKLYILPPPSGARDFLAYYRRRVTKLTSNTDATGLPLTPVHLDEAIKLASRIRAHTRANEPTLAAIAESDLEEIFDDMRDDEENIMEEQQERVKPDDTWL
jgi:hypothetical protein